ncbi:MAG: calcium-binding protein [Pseudomonadota bacterium]
MANLLVSNLNDSGDGSLRAALDLARKSLAPDTISFADGLSGTINLSTGLVADARDPFTINGDTNGDGVADITISGGDSGAALDVTARTTLSLSNINFDGIDVTNGERAAISVLGDLTIENVVFSDISVSGAFNPGVISVDGEADLTDVLFEDVTITASFSSNAHTIRLNNGTVSLDRVGFNGDLTSSAGDRTDVFLMVGGPGVVNDGAVVGVGIDVRLTPGENFAGISGETFETLSVFDPQNSLVGVSGTSASDLLDASDDTAGLALLGFGGDDTLIGGSGNDSLAGGTGVNMLDGGDGFDIAHFASPFDAVTVTRVGETVTVTSAIETTTLENIESTRFADGGGFGFEGLLNIATDLTPVAPTTPPATPTPTPAPTGPTEGNDTLFGTLGDDVIRALGGDDRVLGNSGNDNLNGQRGNDFVNGQRGNDTLLGGLGNDTMVGGLGSDDIKGSIGKDQLRGLGGRDTLDGGGGKDNIVGGGGRDLIIGGKGADTLKGGGGPDVFQFKTGAGRDTITDFAQRRDKIEITNGAEEFEDLRISQQGDDVLIRFANVQIKVEDDDVDAFSGADFIFS